MSVRTDRVNLIVDVNGNTALNNLNEMKKKAADLKAEMAGLKKNTEEYKKKAAELKQVEGTMADLKKQIGITALSQKELVAELNKLKALKGSVQPFSKEFNQLQKEIAGVEKRLYDVKNGVQGFASFWSKINDQVKQFGALAAAYLGFEFLTQQFGNIIRNAGKMSDQLAAVRKTTGLTADEVKILNEELGKLDTRTSTSDLRDLAKEAGKLGIEGKDNVLEFVTAVDQIKVALGEDLGQDAITQIGKLVGVFRLKEEFGLEGSLLKVGSTINELGAASEATEANIVNFTSRLAGIAPSAKISIQDVAALGATLDSLGVQTELGSTAVGGVLAKLVTDIKGFAEISGVSAEKLSKVFKEQGALEALKLVVDGVKKSTGGFDEFILKLGDVGIEGSRAKAVFGVLANNLDKLEKNQQVAAKSFQEGTSITKEFALQNETFGATLDKLGKEFNKLISSSAVTNFLKGAVEGALSFVKAIRNIPEFIQENKIALLSLAVGVALLNKEMIISAAVTIRDSVAKAYNAVVTRLTANTTGLAVAAQGAYIVVTNLLTGRITLATAAQRLYNLALSFGAAGLGAFITVVSGAVLIFSAFAGKTKELTAAQKAQLDVQSALSEITEQEETKARSLFNAITKTNLGYDEKKKLLSQLIAINPEYLSGLTLENIATAQGQKILDNYITSLRKVNEEKARRKVIDDLEEQKTKLQNSVRDAFVEEKDANGNVIGRKAVNKKGVVGTLIGKLTGDDDVIDKLNKDQEALDEVNKKLDSLYEDVAANTKKVITETGNSADELDRLEGKVSKPKKDTEAQQRKERLQNLLKSAKEFEEELRAIKQGNIDKAKNDDVQEIISIDNKYAKLLAKAEDFYQQLKKAGVDATKQFENEKALIEDSKYLEQLELAKKNLEKRQKAEQTLNDTNYKYALEQQRNNDAQTILQYKRLYADGAISKKEYEDQAAKLGIEARQNEIAVAEKWGTKSKLAAKDVADFKARLEQEGLDAAIKAIEDTLEADKNAADERKKLQEERIQAIIDFIDTTVQYGQGLLNIQNAFDQAAANREQAALNREKRANEEKKKGYKKLLDDKLISEQQYNRRVTAADEEMERKERAMRRRQAEREKRANIYQAIINTFSAIAEALPDIPLSILAGITGFAQVSAISSQELPELGLGDWIRQGRTHKQGGINANIEKDEAVISARAMTNDDVVTVTGTTAQITSALNSRAGGRAWASGAQVQVPEWLNRLPAGINPVVPMVMARGGFINVDPLEAKQAVNRVAFPAGDPVSADFINEIRGLRQDVNNWNTKLKSIVVIKDLEEEQAKYDAAKKASA